MDYEKKIKNALNDKSIPFEVQAWLEEQFPELKESKDEKIIKWLIDMVEEIRKANPTNADHNGKCSEALAWLEKQAEHANFRNKIQIGDKVTRNRDGVLVNLSQLNRVAKKDEKQGEQKSAWSEEDESYLKEAIENCYECGNNYISQWLKSLKDRVQPQTTWKPNDEQMEVLWSATEKYLESDNENVRKLRGEVLESLYEDLKKLKEE